MCVHYVIDLHIAYPIISMGFISDIREAQGKRKREIERERFIMIFYLGSIWRQTGSVDNNL